MQEDINQFKEKNGNVNYTVKELLYGFGNKQDKNQEKIEGEFVKIHEKIDNIQKEQTKIKVHLFFHKVGLVTLFALAGFILKTLLF